MSGTVTDSSGALVQGAKITATNSATNLVQHATTNASGVFTIPLLPPGGSGNKSHGVINFNKNW